jgi:hypothetical protein
MGTTTPSNRRRFTDSAANNGNPKGASVFQSGAHQVRAYNRLPVVAYGNCSGTNHLSELCE